MIAGMGIWYALVAEGGTGRRGDRGPRRRRDRDLGRVVMPHFNPAALVALLAALRGARRLARRRSSTRSSPIPAR